MTDALLILNGGSSSLKFAVFADQPEVPLLMKGAVSSLSRNPVLKVAASSERAVETPLGPGPLDMGEAVGRVAEELDRHNHAASIRLIGHRIVHGGRDFSGPALLDEATLAALHQLEPLAPLHEPINLQIVEEAAIRFPDVAQYGCFDTAFHTTRPRIATLYGLPRELTEAGIMSYGFHGLSYGYIAGLLRKRDSGKKGCRTIIAHLGSGASLCAIRDGKSVATTMGFSTLDGLVMSSRCGAIDPGVILYLLEQRNMTPTEISDLLYHRSGLLGVSGISPDMQTLLSSDDPAAKEAVELFIYRASREIGSLAAVLGGLDRLVFTGGIGENAPEIRARISEAAAWLGVSIDPDRNRAGEISIGAPDSSVELLVIPTDEERAMAEGVRAARGWQLRRAGTVRQDCAERAHRYSSISPKL